MNMKAITFIILSIVCLQAFSQADTPDSTKKRIFPEPYHRNVIKFNPTPMLLLGEVRNITFSYERVLNKNQSVVVQMGYLLFPRITSDTIANLVALTGKSKQGVNLSFDYRYYPVARNRRPAPDGVYIGAYVSYYGFQFSNDLDFIHSSVVQNGEITGNLNFVNVGFSLGYQFVFWKRLTLDLLLFGPSFSMYHRDLQIKGDINEEEMTEIQKELADKLANKYPALREIFSEESLTLTGSHSNFGTGFRYSFQIGFHF